MVCSQRKQPAGENSGRHSAIRLLSVVPRVWRRIGVYGVETMRLYGGLGSSRLAPTVFADVEVFGLSPARLTITFLSLADVRPVPRPVVPSGKRSFGSRSAVLTASRAIASTERVRDGGEGGERRRRRKKTSLVCGGRVGVRAAASPTGLPPAGLRALPRHSSPLPSPPSPPVPRIPRCQPRPSTSLSAVVAKDRYQRLVAIPAYADKTNQLNCGPYVFTNSYGAMMLDTTYLSSVLQTPSNADTYTARIPIHHLMRKGPRADKPTKFHPLWMKYL